MKWFECEIGGQRWTVEIRPSTDPDLADPDEDVRGVTYAERCLVIISEDLCEEARAAYAWHELFEHAINDVSGASYELGRKCATRDEQDDLEERVVRARTPSAYALARAFGFRFPKGPTE